MLAIGPGGPFLNAPFCTRSRSVPSFINASAAAPVALDTNKLQERENIFRPLSVKDDGAKPKTDGTQSDGGQKSPDQATDTKPDTQVNTTAKPDTGATTTTGAGTTATPTDTTTVKPDAPAADAGKNATPPGQNQNVLGDPRFINGSPTTGTIRVIIK